MKKIMAGLLAGFVIVLLLLPASTALAFQIQLEPGAEDPYKIYNKLKTNSTAKANIRNKYGEDCLWPELDRQEYTIIDRVISGAPKPDDEETDILRYAMAYPTREQSIRVPEQDYTYFETPMPFGKEGHNISHSARINVEFGYRSNQVEYEDKPSDWESQKNYWLEDGAVWQEFHGYQALVRVDYNPEDGYQYKGNAYAARGPSRIIYDVVLVPEGQADYVAFVTIDVYIFVSAPSGISIDVDGTITNYGEEEAAWVAASKALWESQTSPAIDAAIDSVFDMDFRFVRQQLYTGEFVFGGKKEQSSTDTGIIRFADQSAGEDGGTSIPAAVAVGVLGGGAAVAAAASSNGDGDDKKKAYKMYVQKDFGDAIRRGASPVVIRARIAEVDEKGDEHDRNDLTALITAAGEGMTVHNVAYVDRYCEATVSVPQDVVDERANITFTFTGEGGTFANTVIFRVVDGPSLKFVEEAEEAGTYNLLTAVQYINMIPGDNFTYAEKFMVLDATTPPEIEDMSADAVEGYDIRFEKTESIGLYKLIVKNDTPALAEEEKDLFAEPKQVPFTFRVRVKGEEEPIEGYVTLYMYPEGITVKSDMSGKKNGLKYIRVQAYEKENAGDFDKKWQVSRIKFTLAVKGKDRAVIDPPEASYRFKKLKGSGGSGMRSDKEQSLAEKYQYKQAYGENNGKFTYEFEPNSNLVEPDDGTFYMVLLPAAAEYQGKSYTADVPLRLRGKDMETSDDWEKEYNDLKRRVEKFSLPENKQMWLERLNSCALEPKVSVEEMRLVSKWILREYMDYWTNQSKKSLSEANMYNVIVNGLEWTKFVGDCAFSFLMTMYAGPVAEALISPAKDFVTGAVGEVIAAKTRGLDVDVDQFEFSKNLAAAGDNLVSGSIDLKNWRKAAATLGAYFCYAAIKNYLLKLREENESDFFGALCSGFKDMTGAALKSKGGELLGKWIKDSETFQKKFGPMLINYCKETNMTTLQHRLNDALGFEGELRKLAGFGNDAAITAKVTDVVEKYITELVGEGCSKVREVYDSSKFSIEGGDVTFRFNLDLFDACHFGVQLNLTKMLTNMTGPLFGWIYDYFFGNVPAAPAVIALPKDPGLPPMQC